MLIAYLICMVLMLGLFAYIGFDARKRGEIFNSRQAIWTISLFAGVFWPLSLAYLIVVVVSRKYG